jgi:amino acid adenylation domain-containing protein
MRRSDRVAPAMGIHDTPPQLSQVIATGASRFADRTAVESKRQTRTYGQMFERASDLARRLTFSRGPVALVAAPQLETYEWYLAIQLANRTVVPLPPNDQERAAFALELARPTTVVDPADTNPVTEREARRADSRIGEEQRPVTYILFTSGSTGRPKGVPVEHTNVVHYLASLLPSLSNIGSGRFSHTFALTFDPSVHDIYCAWATGSTLVIPERRHLLDPVSYITEKGLTHWFSVPSSITLARRIGNLRAGSLNTLRYAAFGGEPLKLAHARDWRSAAPQASLFNVYGPTELTIACSSYHLDADVTQWPATSNGTVPIGFPFPGLDWRLGDGRVGDVGELLVCGPQTISGYLDPNDDADRFVNETTGDMSIRWYRTGDIVEVTDHSLVHIGRTDRQVKIQGHRVELGEVEYLLERVGGVRTAAAWTENMHGLTYIHAVIAGDTTLESLRQAALQMPVYMRPRRIHVIEDVPRGENGKTDYSALARQFGG